MATRSSDRWTVTSPACNHEWQPTPAQIRAGKWRECPECSESEGRNGEEGTNDLRGLAGGMRLESGPGPGIQRMVCDVNGSADAPRAPELQTASTLGPGDEEALI